ncbi:hypothetical protein [Amycolatopsis sp. NPDC059657]|uniref:hypothetical protein n=1 Tax=Amycolatopsis sp. NPDC059657 TaxID=3346899 RepID=UPI0036700623
MVTTEPQAKRTLLDRVMIPMLVAVLAVAGSAVGSFTANLGNAANQRSQFAEQNAREDRAKKTEAYSTLIDAASAYFEAASTANTCVRMNRFLKPNDSVLSFCPEQITSAKALYPAYTAATSKVVIYGSEEAYRLSAEMGRLLAKTYPTFQVGTNGIEFAAVRVERREYDVPRGDFIKMMCHELPAVPRRNC